MVSSNVSGSGGVYMDTSFDFTPKVAENCGVDFKNFMNNSKDAKVEVKNDIVKDKTNEDMNYLNNNSLAAQKINSSKAEESAKLTKDMIAKIEKAIKEVVMKEFGVSEEELINAMNVLGISFMDLLENSNLTALSMQLNGVDEAILMVTDAELALQFKTIVNELREIVSEFAEQLNMEPEELKGLLTDVSDENLLKTETETENDAVSNEINQTEKVEVNQTTKDDSQGFDSKDNKKESSNLEPREIVADIVNNLKSGFAEAIAKSEYSTTSYIDGMDIIEQIMESVKVTGIEEGTALEIQLNPEHLGKISLNVVSKDGAITAQITAQDEAVRRIIESQLVTLKENLNNQGIKVEAVEVTISARGFEQQFNDQNSKADDGKGVRKTRKAFKDEFEDEEENDEVVQEVLKSQGNSVNLMA